MNLQKRTISRTSLHHLGGRVSPRSPLPPVVGEVFLLTLPFINAVAVDLRPGMGLVRLGDKHPTRISAQDCSRLNRHENFSRSSYGLPQSLTGVGIDRGQITATPKFCV